MKRLMALFAMSVALAGCATITPTQKKWTEVGVGVLVVGAIAAYEIDHGHDDPRHTKEDGTLVQIPCEQDGTCP